MKKQISKLAFSTEKIVSLTKTQLQSAQGGSNNNCLASSGAGGGGRSRTCPCY